MINGAHLLIYSIDPDADRAFFRDVLEFRSVDVGGGWLIFALPPAEAAMHPVMDEGGGQMHAGHVMMHAVVYFMCDDVRATVAWLAERGTECKEIEEEPWGLRTTVRLPSGGELGLYQPLHETAITASPGS
jgi:predicted enzyme related to lactoylglutathione lyase